MGNICKTKCNESCFSFNRNEENKINESNFFVKKFIKSGLYSKQKNNKNKNIQ